MNKWLVSWGTQKEEPRREVVGKIFNLAKMESTHTGKMTKGKVAEKDEFEKMRCRSLEAREIESQLSRDTPKGKSARSFWGKGIKRRKL